MKRPLKEQLFSTKKWFKRTTN